MVSSVFSKVAPYSQKKIFDIVLDIGAYSSFVPYCTKSEIIPVSDLANLVGDFGDDLESARGHICAIMGIGFRSFNYQYLSSVKFDSSTFDVFVHSYEDFTACPDRFCNNPFKYLRNHFKIQKLEENVTEIEYLMEFEMKNFVTNLAVSSSIDMISSEVLQSFLDKADSLYG